MKNEQDEQDEQVISISFLYKELNRNFKKS